MNTPAEIAKNYEKIAVLKGKLPFCKMLLLAVMAGAFIALAGVGSTVASARIGTESEARRVSACVFPAGLAMVLISGSELFTGNSLMVLSVLQRKISVGAMLRNWGVVYIGNLIGAVLVAALTVYGHTPDLYGGALAESMVRAAQTKAAMGLGDALIRGVLCNFLVCIAVWMSFAAETVSGRILGLFFPILLFVLCGFEHCVANLYYLPAGLMAAAEYGIAADGLTVGTALLHNLIPVTIGNVLGGTAVGTVYWAVYRKGMDEKTA